ncbi:MAG: type II toxin-antitoxin system RelE/ParE family toxin [Bacteroidota bacterium]
MTYSIQLLPQARTDLQEIMAYYKERKKGLDARFFKHLVASIRLLHSNPLIFQVRYKRVRQAPIKKFPFWIHYLVDEQQQQVAIIAVLHSARDPRNWMERV